jgi:hypothetical protein
VTEQLAAPWNSDKSEGVITAPEIADWIERPDSRNALLKNLEIAWDKELLVQNAFWQNATLLQFPNGNKIAWDTQIARLGKHRSPALGLDRERAEARARPPAAREPAQEDADNEAPLSRAL